MTIPDAFWRTHIGDLYFRAMMWARDDEAITPGQAAELTGRSVSAISQLVDRGKLTAYHDPTDPNPTHAVRLSKNQVLALKTRAYKKS